MSALNLSQRDITAYDGTPVRLVYDQEADILEIFFGINEPATGIELTDHIVLRLNQQTKCAVVPIAAGFFHSDRTNGVRAAQWPLLTCTIYQKIAAPSCCSS